MSSPIMALSYPWNVPIYIYVYIYRERERNRCKIRLVDIKQHYAQIFVLVRVSNKCVLAAGLAKELPEIEKITTYLNLIDCTMVLLISTCKFDAKNTPDAFNISRPVLKGPGPGK